MRRLGRRRFSPRAAEGDSTFARALRFHIQSTTLFEAREPPDFRQVVATLLVFFLAGVLMVVLAMS